MKRLMRKIFKYSLPISTFYLIILSVLMLGSCEEQENPIPKPYGYMRIHLPEHNYKLLEDNCPYTFELPEYATVMEKKDSGTYCHKNITFDEFNATLHLSYFKVTDDIAKYLEYSRSLAYQHQVKADAIVDSVFVMPENNLYGTVHHIEGNAASPFQFYVTDSTDNFLRGSLYFNSSPNYDSVQISLNHLKIDMKHLIETTRWKE